MDRLAHFDIAVQLITGSNLKFTNFLSRNPIGRAAIEDKYDKEFLINILAEHAALNAKYGSFSNNQSNARLEETGKERKQNRDGNEQKRNQSETNRTFQNKNHVNKLSTKENTTSGQSDISTVKSSLYSKTITIQNVMNRENFYHWGASREIIEFIRRKNESPETRRLVERRETLARPGTMRRRYDPQSQRTIFAPSTPNERSREEIAEIDEELTHRANRIDGGYIPMEVIEEEENRSSGRRSASRSKHGGYRRQRDNTRQKLVDC